MRSLRWLILLGLAGAAVWASTFQVHEGESVIVSRFGDPRRRVDEAGLAFRWPAPVDTLLRVDRRVRVTELEPAEYLTSDKKNVLVSCLLAWSVDDPLRFVQSASDPAAVAQRLADLVHTHAGTVLGAHPLSALVSTDEKVQALAAINAEIAERTAVEASETYGVRVMVARIRRLTFPTQNKKAVFRRMEAERQKIAQEIRSEGTERAERIRADAELQAALLLSEARRKAAETRGTAEAEAARIYNEAYARDPRFYELVRTLEAYDKIFDENARVVIPSDSELLEVLQGIDDWDEGEPPEEAPQESEGLE